MKEIVTLTLPQTGLEDLISASEQLLTASEAQFEQIRSEKWFNRLFDTITFSHKSEKRLGEQICTLAQAQSILLQMLPRMAEQNAQVADFVQAQETTINMLSKNDLQLLQLYKDLKNSLHDKQLGVQKAAELAFLPESDKLALSACLRMLSTQYSQPNEAQRNYFNEIHRVLDCEGQGELQLEELEDLQEDTRKQFLQCCIEYMFLDGNSFNFSPEQQEFIDYFNLGRKSINEAKNYVTEMFHARGIDGIIGKYTQKADSLIPDEFEVEFGDLSGQGVQQSKSIKEPIPDISEFEEITLSGIIHIPPEETRTYRYKIIHFQGVINCEGSLEFDACVLHYGEAADETTEIGLAETASLSMHRCTIENHSCDDSNSFINAKALEQEIELVGCEFINCCYFLVCNSDLLMEQCQITNAGAAFISQKYSDKARIWISECEFHFSERPDFFPEKRNDNIIHSYGAILLSSCLIQGNLKIQSTEDAYSIESIYYSILSSSGKYISIEYSSFLGVSNICEGDCGFISSCVFEHCAHIFSFSCDGADINDCRFDYCTTIADGLAPSSTILNSQFNYCFNTLITSSYGGGLTVRYCELNNIEMGDTWGDPGILTFRSSKKDFTHSILELCKFRGITIHGNHGGFLIVGSVIEKIKDYTVRISKCTFSDCTTERTTGKIIKEYDAYYGPFNVRKEIHAVFIGADCKGLDKVNQGNGLNEDIVIKAKNKDGLSIGLSAAGAVIAGVPGMIAARTITQILKDDDMHVE